VDALARGTRPLALLNVLRLLAIVLSPFSTALRARYLQEGGGRSHVAAAVYSLTFVLMSVGFSSVWVYASRGGRLLVPGFTDDEIRRMTIGFIMGLTD